MKHKELNSGQWKVVWAGQHTRGHAGYKQYTEIREIALGVTCASLEGEGGGRSGEGVSWGGVHDAGVEGRVRVGPEDRRGEVGWADGNLQKRRRVFTFPAPSPTEPARATGFRQDHTLQSCRPPSPRNPTALLTSLLTFLLLTFNHFPECSQRT